MSKDQSWISHRGMTDRRKSEYVRGVDGFLEFAFRAKEDSSVLKWPCMKGNLILYHD